MADFNFAERRRDLVPAGTWGNVSMVQGSYTGATTEVITDRIALCKVPANSTIVAVVYNIGELGVGTTLDLGTEAIDGTPSDDTNLASALADATSGVAVPVPVSVTEQSYVFATVGGANIGAAGVINVTVLYRYDNA
jgi:hypothetical protein